MKLPLLSTLAALAREHVLALTVALLVVALAAGEDFDQRWSIELDGQSPQGRSLLAAGPLTCTASWRTLGLSNAEVLHIVDVPDILKACNKPGHHHFLGFCLSPIFQN